VKRQWYEKLFLPHLPFLEYQTVKALRASKQYLEKGTVLMSHVVGTPINIKSPVTTLLD
jgi:hypothetical protein